MIPARLQNRSNHERPRPGGRVNSPVRGNERAHKARSCICDSWNTQERSCAPPGGWDTVPTCFVVEWLLRPDENYRCVVLQALPVGEDSHVGQDALR